MRPRPWTREELIEFVKIYPDTDIEVMMEKFGRSYRGIICKAHDLRIKQNEKMRAKRGKDAHLKSVGPRRPRKKWPVELIDQILADYPHMSNYDLAIKYNTSPRAICCLASGHDVKKSREYLKLCGQRAAQRLNEMLRQKR